MKSKAIIPNLEKTVCASCFDDEFLKELIESSEKIGDCIYCDNHNVKICDLIHVASHIEDSISFEWDDPVNCLHYESAEGGYQGIVFSTDELLTGELEIEILNDKLRQDIDSLIPDTGWWCKKSPYSLAENEKLFYGWKTFSNYVKFDTRYVLLESTKNDNDHEKMSSDEILKSISSFIEEYELIKTIKVSKEIYRVRIVNKNTLLFSAQELGSPPRECCTLANRMSPAGISMFYGAFDENTAIEETYHHNVEKNVIKKAICGVWNPVRDLIVIDLSNIPSIPSLFDANNRHRRESLAFLNDFVLDFCKPIERTDKVHIEYVPTQIVTEYFRHVLFQNIGKIDGIIYHSSKVKEKKCVVIFANSNQCKEKSTSSDEERILNLSNVKEIQLTKPVKE